MTALTSSEGFSQSSQPRRQACGAAQECRLKADGAGSGGAGGSGPELASSAAGLSFPHRSTMLRGDAAGIISLILLSAGRRVL